MKILLDHNVPVQLKAFLKANLILSTRNLKWDQLRNGDLLAAAESAGFDVMITGDQNLSYQQNNSKRVIHLLVITEIRKKIVLSHWQRIGEALTRVRPGGYELVEMPRERKGIRALE